MLRLIWKAKVIARSSHVWLVRKLSTCVHPLFASCLIRNIPQRKFPPVIKIYNCFSQVHVNFGKCICDVFLVIRYADLLFWEFHWKVYLFATHRTGIVRWCRILFPYLLQLTRFRGSCFMTERPGVAYSWHVIAARFNDMRSARYFSTCSGKPANRTRNWRVEACARVRRKGFGNRLVSDCWWVHTSVSDSAAPACSLVNGTGGFCRDPAKE